MLEAFLLQMADPHPLQADDLLEKAWDVATELQQQSLGGIISVVRTHIYVRFHTNKTEDNSFRSLPIVFLTSPNFSDIKQRLQTP